MANVEMIGRVLPERQHFEISGQKFSIKIPEHEVDAWLIFGVIDNQLSARFTGKLGNLSNYRLKHMLSEIMRGILDSEVFATGQIFDLDLIGLTRENQSRSDGSVDFHYFDPLDEVVKGRKAKHTANEIRELFIAESGFLLRRCLNDLSMALKHHLDTPFYCYRALETIKGHLGGEADETGDKKQWEVMRETLGVERAKIEIVQKYATPLRHGKLVTYRGDEWREIVSTTWDIVEAYIGHLRAK